MEKLREILKEYTDIEPTENARLIGDLGLDSFLIVYFLSEVEDNFGIDIHVPDDTDQITIGDVLDWIREARV